MFSHICINHSIHPLDSLALVSQKLIVTVEKCKYRSCHCTKEKSKEFFILLSQAQASVQTKFSV